MNGAGPDPGGAAAGMLRGPSNAMDDGLFQMKAKLPVGALAFVFGGSRRIRPLNSAGLFDLGRADR